ncbi:divergent polysaccharide deacetylase family protein [Paenibacillus agricola]|uniref:Divergent polysaccharide deacetylase family protein n=1 Tax=Paenibacillus agricola TaxID=2716264 RepID=A0ABX0JK93_9BACL|nr:divergent polysaccharide deacetylase family protein [Paenibacillus agricola]NHN35019.1 divergent polysaccharide deacetylase family protein [Paenibacillus agricola]
MTEVKHEKKIFFCIVALTVLLPNIKSAAENDLYFVQNVAIVIDDFGSDMEGIEEMMILLFQITVAVMPLLPSMKRDADGLTIWGMM